MQCIEGTITTLYWQLPPRAVGSLVVVVGNTSAQLPSVVVGRCQRTFPVKPEALLQLDAVVAVAFQSVWP